jgi:hypothetical protein
MCKFSLAKGSFLLTNSMQSVTGEKNLCPWEENGKKGVEGIEGKRGFVMGREWEEEDLLWEENRKKGPEGLGGKKRICCGKRMGRREWKE